MGSIAKGTEIYVSGGGRSAAGQCVRWCSTIRNFPDPLGIGGVPPLTMAGLLLWQLSNAFGCLPVRYIKGKRIAPQAFPSVTTPVCGLVRNDGEIRKLPH